MSKAHEVTLNTDIDLSCESVKSDIGLDHTALMKVLDGVADKLRGLWVTSSTLSAELKDITYHEGQYFVKDQPVEFTPTALKQFCKLLGLSSKSLDHLQSLAKKDIPIQEGLESEEVFKMLLLQELKQLWTNKQLEYLHFYLFNDTVYRVSCELDNFNLFSLLKGLSQKYNGFKDWYFRQFVLDDLVNMTLVFSREESLFSFLQYLTEDDLSDLRASSITEVNLTQDWQPALIFHYNGVRDTLVEYPGVYYKETGLAAIFTEEHFGQSYTLKSLHDPDVLDTYFKSGSVKFGASYLAPLIRQAQKEAGSLKLWPSVQASLVSCIGKKGLKDFPLSSYISNPSGKEIWFIKNSATLYELVETFAVTMLHMDIPKTLKTAKKVGSLMSAYLES